MVWSSQGMFWEEWYHGLENNRVLRIPSFSKCDSTSELPGSWWNLQVHKPHLRIGESEYLEIGFMFCIFTDSSDDPCANPNPRTAGQDVYLRLECKSKRGSE